MAGSQVGPSGFLERHPGDPDPEPEEAPELSPAERELFEQAVAEGLQARQPVGLLDRLEQRVDELERRLELLELEARSHLSA